MRIISILILVMVANISFSQSPYKRQQSAGEIPDDLKLSIKEKIYNDTEELRKENNNHNLSDIERKFLENTNIRIDELLQSGKILFGDEMTTYINKLGKLILEKNNKPELIEKLRFYTVKSSVVNAFTTHQGMIFVNVGLLAQVENESQLAFVLAHEISHYIQKHVLESHLNTLEYVNKRNNKDYDEVITELSSYSKGQEFESDSIGYMMYTKAGYNPEDASKAMNVLQYSHLPFDEIPVNKDFFNKDSYKLNLEKYFSDELMTYKDISDKDDSRSTHPNIKSRKEKMNKLASFESEFNLKTEYLLSKEEFEKVQKIARLDNLKNNITSRNYIKVVYESYLLKRLMPNEPYIDYCLAKSLYAISKLKTYENFYTVFSNDDFEGEISKVYHLFSEQLSNYEINILALKHLLVLNDSSNIKFEDDLINDLVNKINFDCTKFRKNKKKLSDPTKLAEVTFLEKDSVELSKLTKIDRILYFQKLKKHKEGQVVPVKKDEYYLNAFINEMSEQNFINRFDIKNEEESKDDKNSFSSWGKKIVNDTVSIDGLIIVDPLLVLSSDNKGTKKKKSEKLSNELQQVIGKTVEKLDMKYVISSREGNVDNKLSNYNGEAALKEWLYQYATYEEYGIIPINSSELETYTYDNNVSFVMLLAIYSNRGMPVYGMIYTTLSTIALYPVLPFLAFENFSPRYMNYFYTKIIDTRTNQVVFDKMDHTNKKLKEYNIRSILYYNLSQLKK
ncbi:M48 family metalloprotease [Flavobacteriales bacterium]|nr:M48 family metalloprotease [Flavobacteriales bacterium]